MQLLMSGVLIVSNDTLKTNEGLLTDVRLGFINKVNKEYGVRPITVGNNTGNKQYDTFEVWLFFDYSLKASSGK